MKIPGKLLALVCVMLLAMVTPGLVAAQQQRVEVELSQHRISIDESVILSVRAYGLDSELDISDFDNDFSVITRSSSRQVTIENGKRTNVSEWILELIPKRLGAQTVPAVRVGTEQSQLLTLLVEQPASGKNRDLYIEASVDNSEPYVQSQVIYTLRVYQDVRFLDASLQVPEMDNAVIQQLGEERNFQDTVDGRNYAVTEIRYTVFPQKSGKVTIPSIVLQAVIAVDKNQVPNTRTRTRRLTRRANDIELNVQPRPAGLTSTWWLPAREVRLQSEWSDATQSLQVGQPITRTIHLMAQGVSDTQLPEIPVPEVSGLSIYADSPTSATNKSENGLLAQQTNTWAVIPQRAGELILPEMQVSWFNTDTGEERIAILPEEKLIVLGGVESSADSTLTNQSAVTDTSQISGQSSVAEPAAESAEELAGAPGSATDSIADAADPSTSQSQNDANAMAEQVALRSSSTVKRWKTIAAAIFSAWMLSFAGLWLWLKRRSSSIEPAEVVEDPAARFRRRAGSKASLEPIRLACESGDASSISNSVLNWGAMVWPGSRPTNLPEIANRLQSPKLREALESIDQALYRPSGSVNSVAAESIPELLKHAIHEYQDPAVEMANENALPAL